MYSNSPFGFNGNKLYTGLTYKGLWDASTNNPTLTSSVGVAGDFYIVSVAGTTNLNGITDWQVSDWAIFEGSVWQKIDNHDLQCYSIIQDEGTTLPQQSVIDFQGAGVTASNGTGKTIVTIPGMNPAVFGSFYDKTTQSTALGVVKAIELNTTDISNGVSIANNTLSRPTRITVNTTGVYNLQFSAQLNRTSGGNTKQIDFWLRKNELDQSWTNTSLNVQANANKLVAAWNFFISLNAGQYVELMWTQDDAIDILAQAAGVNFPETPSVIVTMNKIN